MKRIFAISLGLLMAMGLFAQEQDLDAKYAADLLKPGTPAPEFVLNDINGNAVKMSQFRGKTVVLIFWASWCPDCRAEVPALKKYVAENELGGVQLFDAAGKKESKVGDAYQVKWIPSQYIIGPDGKVVLGTVVLDKVVKALNSK